MKTRFLLYGTTGYTGQLIAHYALAQGLRPIIAGRNAVKMAAQGTELSLDHRVFGLDEPAAVDEALADIEVVLNCAGPFARTAKPLVDSCLRTRTHYLDLAGEVPEFEALAARDDEAGQAGVMLLPGVGFGIVPTDCLAAYLKAGLPSATHLTLAFAAEGGVSQGTATVLIRDILTEGVIRRNGQLIPARPAAKRRQIDFGQGPTWTVTNPWRGDIATAFYSTGIPNIEVYTAFPAPVRGLMSSSRYLARVWGSAPVQNLLKSLIRRLPPGPNDEQLAKGFTQVWGEATDETSRTVAARLQGPEAYLFTALSALAVVNKVLKGQVLAGFQTPALVYGPDFILDIDGVRREDLN